MEGKFKYVVLYLLILIARKVLFGIVTSHDEWVKITHKAHKILDAEGE